jgi:hypothetical protein
MKPMTLEEASSDIVKVWVAVLFAFAMCTAITWAAEHEIAALERRVTALESSQVMLGNRLLEERKGVKR